MSLVAYGASDSENSDSEESVVSKSTDADNQISDEEDYKPIRNDQRSSASSSTPTTRAGTGYLQCDQNPLTLSALPAPKERELGIVDAAREDELDELVKPKESQLVDAPKPPGRCTGKKPTRIMIPALMKDEDEEQHKKPRQPAFTSGKGSDLFSLLPRPSHGAKKELNRPLIPHTLTKRTNQSGATQKQSSKHPGAMQSTVSSSSLMTSTALSETVPSRKHQSAFNALTGYESDSDDEGESGSFFMLDSQQKQSSLTSSTVSTGKDSAPDVGILRTGNTLDRPQTKVTSSETVSEQVTTKAVSALSANVESGDASTTQPLAADDSDSFDNTKGFGIPVVNQDAPLSFSSAILSRGWSLSPLVSPMTPELYVAPSEGSSKNSAQVWQTQQHLAQESVEDYLEEADTDEADSSTGREIQQMISDQQFQRLGGKRKLSLEDIEIIEANVDDQVDPSGLMKGMTEETSYQPHRKKDNLPSVQQRRKKQIHYLAFQAKERELELKNMWAQNKMNKNHLRSKYGF